MRTTVLTLAAALGVSLAAPLPLPRDPKAAGPYAVGTRRVPGTVDPANRNFTVDVWYPAANASVKGAPVVYDIRDQIPPTFAAKLPGTLEELGCAQTCSMNPGNPDCYADLPVYDNADGTKLPSIVFIHGTAGWSGQSLQQAAHWASRGFAVISATYPGITTMDLLALISLAPPPHPIKATDQEGDTLLLLQALRTAAAAAPGSPEYQQWGWLLDHVDVRPERMAIIGHSAGGFAIEALNGQAALLVPMAGHGTRPAPAGFKQETLILGAKQDGIVPAASNAEPGFTSSPAPKRLALADRAGHLFCSDICAICAVNGGLVKTATSHGIWQMALVGSLATDGCQTKDAAKFDAPERGWAFVNYATSAALESVILGDAAMGAALSNIEQALDNVAEYKEAL